MLKSNKPRARRLLAEGPRGPRAGMRLGSLKNKYPKEYAELAAKARGQGELLKGRGGLGPAEPRSP